ncbi:hypothetical protein Tco_1097082 [Tanacetum coccineum]
MDKPNISMEEYIRLEEEKARRHVIVFNDELSSEKHSLVKPRFEEGVLDLDTIEALQFQLGGARRRMSWRQFILALGLHTIEEMETTRFGLYWVESGRQISNKGDLREYWTDISFEGDFLGTPPSYTIIRDLMLMLCQWLIACSIVGRSQETEKVFEVVRFKEEAFLVLYEGEALGIDDDCARPPSRPAWTMAQRLARVEEDVHEIRGALGKQKEILDSMARDFSRFSTWTVFRLSQIMSQAGVRYTSYTNFPIPYARHTKCRANDANNSTSQQDEQQPDP